MGKTATNKSLSETDAIILDIDKRVAGLLREVEHMLLQKAELQINRSRREVRIFGGESSASIGKLKSPSAIENLLRENGEAMSAARITENLRRIGFPNIDKQTVTSTLIRHHHAGKRFVRVGPNTFDLIERVKQAK